MLLIKYLPVTLLRIRSRSSISISVSKYLYKYGEIVDEKGDGVLSIVFMFFGRDGSSPSMAFFYVERVARLWYHVLNTAWRVIAMRRIIRYLYGSSQIEYVLRMLCRNT